MQNYPRRDSNPGPESDRAFTSSLGSGGKTVGFGILKQTYLYEPAVADFLLK